MKRRTEFIDVEHRGFEPNDVALVHDSLLAAMVADNSIADAWEANAFEGMDFEEAQNAMACAWVEAQRASLVLLNRRMWLFNTERTFS